MASHSSNQPSGFRQDSAQHARTVARRQQLEQWYEQRLKQNLDYDHWAAMSYWTAEDAVSLTLKLAPEAVKDLNFARLSFQFPLTQQFRKTLERVQRAVISGAIPNSEFGFTPRAFADWASQQGIDLPTELKDRLRPANDVCVQPGQTAPLQARERNTFLKLLYGMAKRGYGYDPEASKSSTVKEIYDDLALLGIAVDENTIRNKLKDAARLCAEDIIEETVQNVINSRQTPIGARP